MTDPTDLTPAEQAAYGPIYEAAHSIDHSMLRLVDGATCQRCESTARAVVAAQERASGPETPQGHPSEGTGVPGPHGAAQAADLTPAEQAASDALAVAADLTEDLAEARAGRVETTTHAIETEDRERAREVLERHGMADRECVIGDDVSTPGPTVPGDGEFLTLAQAAGHLHDWARDLDDGTRTDWPAGHPDIIRGIRAAADWLDARDKYETEAREQMRALVDRHGMADRTCLIGDDTRTPDAAVDAVVTILDRVVSGHLDDRDREGEDWSGPHPISIESDARRIIAAVQPHLLATAREAEEAPESAEPTLRDVMAAAYRAGLGIRKFDEYELDTSLGEPVMCREWSITNTHKREIGRLTIRRARYETFVQLDSRRTGDRPQVLTDPTPADILAAAREAGLIGDTDAE